MADDEFDDFSDDDLDDLPANALQHLEASAIRATQHQPDADPESDYGLDDGDEVVNLDDASGPPRASTWVTDQAPQYTQPQHNYDYSYDDNDNENDDHDDHMDVEEPPRRSQADPNALLQRIKKVRHFLSDYNALLIIAARARQGAREEGSRRAEGQAADQGGRR
jgi:hypothetical protein